MDEIRPLIGMRPRLLLYVLCLLLAVLLARLFERIDGTPALTGKASLSALRLLIPAFIYSILYLLTWRPMTALGLFALGGCVLFAANRLKKTAVFEPIVFSDLALLGQILRHPHLYYLDQNLHLTLPGIALVLLLAVGAVLHEPAILPPGWLFAGVSILTAAGWFARRSIEKLYAPLLLNSVSGWGSLVVGLPTALVLQTVGAISQGRANASLPDLSLPDPSRDVVVVQLESFVDLASWHGIGHVLPVWRSLKTRAFAHGSLIVDARGANTMRTEFSVITGIAGADLGFERFDPYLRRHRKGRGIPHRLRTAGWWTSFIHPNDIAFFRRHLAMPELGFDYIADIASFANAERAGPHVSDDAVVGKILETLASAEGPAFVMAVSMENHGPWRSNRQPGKSAGLATYLAHQDNMDRALGRLVVALQRRPCPPVLILYGDHTPALMDCLDIAQNGNPSYLIVDLAVQGGREEPEGDMRPEALIPSALRSA